MSFGSYRWWGCIALALILLFGVAGCSGYKKYTQREGIASFSFEYPDAYKKGFVNVYSDSTYLIRTRWQNDSWLDSHIRVIVFKSGWNNYYDANDFIEHNIQLGHDSEDDYQIIERSSVTIDGIDGEKLIGSYTPPFTHESDLKEPTLVINRAIYFDYDGLVWEIGMLSIEKVAEADEPIWEHLIDTFKILD